MLENDSAATEQEEGISLLEVLVVLAEHLRLIVLGSLGVGVIALGVTYLIAPIYTARTTFLPPAQQQSAAVSALTSLSNLTGLGAGGGSGPKTLSDQYASLIQSVTVADRLIERFGLMKVYEVELRSDARLILSNLLRVGVGKRDGMLGVEFDDESPQRAADVANAVVEELRLMTNTLAVTEAQQRRAFFEAEMRKTKDSLEQAQQALQSSGFNQAALQAEPKSAAEAYARLKAEATTAEVRLQTLRSYLSDDAPEMRKQLSTLAALRAQVARAESATRAEVGPNYVSAYREFKYQEALFEMMARQYELARVDESRDGALIQVVDPATPPERKSRPKRGATALAATGIAALVLVAFVLLRLLTRRAAEDESTAQMLRRLRSALFGRRASVNPGSR